MSTAELEIIKQVPVEEEKEKKVKKVMRKINERDMRKVLTMNLMIWLKNYWEDMILVDLTLFKELGKEIAFMNKNTDLYGVISIVQKWLLSFKNQIESTFNRHYEGEEYSNAVSFEAFVDYVYGLESFTTFMKEVENVPKFSGEALFEVLGKTVQKGKQLLQSANTATTSMLFTPANTENLNATATASDRALHLITQLPM